MVNPASMAKKTAALPMITRLENGRARARMPRTLILEPTRELAAQVEESVRLYGKHVALRSCVIYGGVGMTPQVDTLRRNARLRPGRSPGGASHTNNRWHGFTRTVRAARDSFGPPRRPPSLFLYELIDPLFLPNAKRVRIGRIDLQSDRVNGSIVLLLDLNPVLLHA